MTQAIVPTKQDWPLILRTGLALLTVIGLFWWGLQAAGTRPSRRRNPRAPSTRVQSLLFKRPEWTPAKAAAWAKKNDYAHKDFDVTRAYVRIRQRDPDQFRILRTVSFGHGIKAVVGR